MDIFKNQTTSLKTYRLHVNILEARHLEIANVNTIVSVSVGEKLKHVRARTKNTTNPYFNQLFRFEFIEPLEKFIKHRLRIAVYQKRCFKMIGLCDIELITIWEQPGHQFYHKWAVLSNPRDQFYRVKGYLKCNVQILTDGIYEIQPAISSNKIDGNLLMPFQAQERHQAIYTVTVYHTNGISYSKTNFGKAHLVECKSLYVKVTFAGKTLKTTQAKGEPEWNQALKFIEAIPSLFQTINIELWDQKAASFIGSSVLNLKTLWLGNLPTFGPAFLYLFHSKTSQTTGKILISLSCQLIDRSHPGNLMEIEKVFPYDETNFPPVETYVTAFVVLQCVFFKKKYFDKCVITLKHGFGSHAKTEGEKEHPDEILLENSQRSSDLSWFLGITANNMPLLQTTSDWPATDFRERENNLIKNTTRKILEVIQQSRDQRNRKNQILVLLNLCEKISKAIPRMFETDLDKARSKAIATIIEKTKAELKLCPHECNPQIIQVLEQNVKSILELTNNPQPSFPDLELFITKPRSKKLTKTLIKPEDYLFSPNDDESGIYCGKLRKFFICDSNEKDIAYLDGILWYGRQTDFPLFLNLVENELGNSVNNFQLRVHIYQGTLRPGSDTSGLADPFIKVLAFGQMRETQVKAQTLDPIWDETLLFSTIPLHVQPDFLKTQSIGILFLVLDYDGNDCVELIGRGIVYPKITLLSDEYRPPKLKREPAYNCGEKTAEIIMTAELIGKIEQDEVQESSEITRAESQHKIFAIPEDIRPHFKAYTMEVVFWGIRNFKLPTLAPAPMLVALIECNGVRLESNTARAFPSLNFQHGVKTVQMFLPEEEDYIPPISVFIYEFNYIKQANYKGSAIVPSLKPFLPKSRALCPVKIDLEERSTKILEMDEKPDWWTKYYESKKSKRLVRNLTVYPNELEERFENFQDFLFTFDVKKGKLNFLKPLVSQEPVGNVKCVIRCSPDGETPKQVTYPQNHPLDFTVRVYVVSASHLTPMDINGRSDPYIKLVMGKFTYSDRKNFIYKETDPIFGKCFELKGTFPWDHTLKISVMDHDNFLSDDLIGETCIDIENRYYTKHRAACGIADTYESTGYCRWRDLFKPSEILEKICKESQIELPEYSENMVKIGCCTFDQKNLDKETIALEILQNLNALPNFGYTLVPEHVETRTLYHPKNPGIDQGKLEMWIDIYPGHDNLPPMVDLTPRKSQDLELRVIVWNTVDVLCQDTSLLTQEKSSDIFVKAWLACSDYSQQTDIHFRSMTGGGNFNWRFIFPFCYSQAEHKIITWKRVTFSNDLWKEKLPCVFEIQVWDNDVIFDDFIGSLSLDLSNMPKGSHSAKSCKLEMINNDSPRLSLFKKKRVRAWWPIQTPDFKIGGKIDMELEIMTTEEAKKFPAGLGRQGPQPLVEPNRPGTAFIWALNPMKVFKNLAFGNVGRKLQLMAGITATVTFLVAGWLSLPGILLNKLLLEKEQE